jgi:hypothetical protein
MQRQTRSNRNYFYRSGSSHTEILSLKVAPSVPLPAISKHIIYIIYCKNISLLRCTFIDNQCWHKTNWRKVWAKIYGSIIYNNMNKFIIFSRLRMSTESKSGSSIRYYLLFYPLITISGILQFKVNFASLDRSVSTDAFIIITCT